MKSFFYLNLFTGDSTLYCTTALFLITSIAAAVDLYSFFLKPCRIVFISRVSVFIALNTLLGY